MKQKISEYLNSRFGFFLFAVVLFWLKTYLAYHTAFSLGVDGWFQQLILLINPIATTLLILGLSLFVKDPKKGYTALIVLYIFNSILLFANITYYREFTDFLTIKTIFGSANATKNLGSGVIAMLEPMDILYWIDAFILIYVYKKKVSKRLDTRVFKKRWAFVTLGAAILVFIANLSLAEISRPQLLTRTFDRNYIVKYLGINVYTVYDGIKTAQANQVRASADSSDMSAVLDYLGTHYAEPNETYFGQAKGKNVVYLHLESMQQFLIDMKLPDSTGVMSEVTPFLNSLYHSNDSYSFSNAFHQTGQGKTSDAELMMDNSLFGLPQGSAFTQIGGDNTFQSAPAILGETGNYTSAVFHGNVGSFWNRDNVYKSFGYDYFFDANSSYTLTDENSVEYGLKDKLFFKDSAQYLEQLPQPFYAKFITVSNHFPFPKDEMNNTFSLDTGDETIDGYFNTVHYADAALAEFFQYMKDAGLYDNTIFVLYGDHFGISSSRNKTLAPLIGKNADTWNQYDDAMMQRIPLIIYDPGSGTGKISDVYGGQIDVLPTVLHLLGVDTASYVQLGQDLLSKNHEELVAFRNGTIVTDKYTILGNNVYSTESGNLIYQTPEVTEAVAAIRSKAETQLAMSDHIINGDLLRFYTPDGFVPVDKSEYSYLNSPAQLQQDVAALGDLNTSLYYKNNGVSSVPLYKTNAPELPANQAAAGAAASVTAEPAQTETTE
ncbi:sulfatase [Trichococcus palustris]|uniref:Sulfatase n=1 Tax=Trichococcus palustris TaxID=140314 RepID=A0A143YV74_9LACT|nr:LTA synthase family protein [Trichococcus palustris]CZQ99086.1 sulfatase [Trichococcus palustris]SFK88426.1 lipoteichoic acid synthase [Trichococcus palustris]